MDPKLDKRDFIEIEFTGKVKDGEIFDSNIKQDLEKLHSGHNHSIEPKPFVFCLGEGMFLEAIDYFLVGKNLGEHEIELSPEKAFGKRNPSLIQMIPMKIFKEHGTNPVPGTLLNFDGRIGKILTVSGGRVMVDFNNPLAGKTVVYRINIKRKITDDREKINAMNEFFFKRNLDFEVNEKKLTIKAEKNMKKIIEMFSNRFNEVLGLDVEVIESGKKTN